MRVTNNIYPNLNFSRVVYFNYPKGYRAAKENARTGAVEKKPEPVPENILALFKSAKTINSKAPSIIENSKSVYNYASTTLYEVSENTYNSNKEQKETNSCDNNITRETSFDRDGRFVIVRDYKNKRIIRIDEKTDLFPIEKFTVFLDCSDMENRDVINAQSSYSFVSGELKRYTTSCEAEVDSDRFVSDEAFFFKRKVLTSYDYSYTLVSGTEYSRKYFAFNLHPSFDASVAHIKNRPIRYVEGKIEVNGKICSSSKEISLSRYEFPEE